jgi:hypothetical protein
MPTTRGRCSKCGRSFKRLDTHLRVSATCRDVKEQQSAPPSSSMNIFPTANLNSVASHSNFSTTQPGNLNSSRETSAVSTAYRTANKDSSSPSTLQLCKQSLRLPKSSEEWDEANLLLSVITPSVLQATTIEEKNNILTNGIYDILAGRYGTRNPPRPKKRPRQHDRTLKRVTRLKNEARQALRRARRQGESVSTIQSLSGNFLSLLREHSHLKRKSSRRLQDKEASIAREQCHRNFWRYAKCLLDGDTTSQSSPKFSASAAHSFFSEVYMSNPHQFETPSWMSSPPPPVSGCSMDMSPVSPEELTRVIRKSKSSSAPSPLDRLSYTILKRCPSVHPALLDLFNSVIMKGAVPSAWKVAAVKLIPKSSAREDPSSPGNFRPIALTPCISKLLSGILKERWLRHMRANNYLNSDLQKAFLPTIPGVTEHQAKLAAVIKTARQKKRSLAIAWLDIANAYGSVHHSLIQFSLAHYHAPPEFCRLLHSWYTGLSATISSSEWSTAPVPLRIGVYQGDPLSVAIFLTVMNTLSDTLCSRKDLGFPLPSSPAPVNHILYDDDVCIVSNTPAGCQHQLDMVQRWLEWA